MPPAYERLIGFGLVAFTALACRPSSHRAPTCPSESAANTAARTAAPSPPDPTAPVLAPGTERPELRSSTLDDITRVFDAAPFRAPSSARPKGSVIVAASPDTTGEVPHLYEIDLGSLRVVREARLPVNGSFAGVAASEQGVAVVVNEPDADRDSGEPVFLFDSDLVLRKSLRFEGAGTSVAVEGGTLAVATHTAKGGSLETLELPGGNELGSRALAEPLMDEWVPQAQIAVRGGTVWSLTRGERSYVLRALSRDLKRVLASSNLPGAASVRRGPNGHPGPHHGDGLLAPTTDGVLVLREDGVESYSLLDSKLALGFPVRIPIVGRPAVDPASGRVLLQDGRLAAKLDADRADPVVVFRGGVWRWSTDGTYPIEYDAPVARFFLARQGVFVTKNPALRITVLEWSSTQPDGGEP